MEIPSVVCMRG